MDSAQFRIGWHAGRRSLLLGMLVAATLSCLPRQALALSFLPTEVEWLAWPEYCKARYMVSGAGVDSSFAGRVSEAEVKNWEQRTGPEVWYSLHHYCAGLILAKRARMEPDKDKRAYELRGVLSEYTFTLMRVPESHPIHAEIAARMGIIYGELGDDEAAMQHFDLAIKSCPACPVGYLQKSVFFRAQGDLPDARQILEQGNKALDGASAEIHYFLGLVLLGMKEYAVAQEHARMAYEKGYPLPGLRDKLAAAGYPLTVSKQ